MSTIYDAHLEIFILFLVRFFSCFYFFLLMLSMISLLKNEKCLGMFPSTIIIDISIIYHIYIFFCLSIYSSFYLSVCLYVLPHLGAIWISKHFRLSSCVSTGPRLRCQRRGQWPSVWETQCVPRFCTLYTASQNTPFTAEKLRFRLNHCHWKMEL